ncbi:MAG: SiaC family regulatory phosphoprotein [Bacteroidetes bacterium]|nr:SiaC family regulatory phosphoprotein [Bacteroidota bacterium]
MKSFNPAWDIFLRPLTPVKVRLTRREEEIVRLMIYEYTSRQIAKILHISSRTVEVHRKNVMQKFGVKNAVGLVREYLLLYGCKHMRTMTVAKGTEYTPSVEYRPDTHELAIRGRAVFLDKTDAYRRLLKIIGTNESIRKTGINCVLELTDIDAGSQRLLYELFKVMEGIYKKGKPGSIRWLCSKNNPDIQEVGADLSSLVDLPFTVVMN